MLTKRSFVGALSLAIVAFSGVGTNGQQPAADNTKWGKYIITELPPAAAVDQTGQAAEAATLGQRVKDMTKNVLALNDKVAQGAMYTDVTWIMKANPGKAWVTEHSHPFAEVLGFFGSDPEHPGDLNAVIEISIDGEKHVLTKSALVFVPKNVKHCPLTIQRIDKPVLFFTTGPTTSYDIDR